MNSREQEQPRKNKSGENYEHEDIVVHEVIYTEKIHTRPPCSIKRFLSALGCIWGGN
jgi:hypothetical protein